MSPWNRIQAETDAVQSLVQLYDQARKCQDLFERAQMALPEPLKRFLGLDVGEHSSTAAPRLVAQIPPPQRKRPEGTSGEWVWVRIQDCTPTTLISAVLRAAGGVLSSRAAIEAVQRLKSELPSGSIYNSATRLQKSGVIDRTSGWRLTKPDSAPIIDGDVLWGTTSMFDKMELAAHRREAILHVLKHFEMGLQIVQLVEQLKNAYWVKAPVNKDLLKADVKILEHDRKIRRRGNTNKWELAPAEKGEPKAKAD